MKRRDPITRKIRTFRYWQNAKSPHEFGPPPRPIKPKRDKNGDPVPHPPPS